MTFTSRLLRKASRKAVTSSTPIDSNLRQPGSTSVVSAATPQSGSVNSDELSTKTHQPATAPRIPALDGFRGFALFWMLAYHFVFSVHIHYESWLMQTFKKAGYFTWTCMDAFFLLSGYLIGGILIDAKDSPRFFRTFYIRRAYRILPLYLVILTLNYLGPMAWHLLRGGPELFSASEVPLWAYLTFTQNFWAAFGKTETFTMVVTWSLAVEEQFYLTMPLLVRKLSRSRLTYVLAAAVVCAPLLRVLLHYALRSGVEAQWALMPCRADSLSLGVLCALLVRTPHLWNALLAKRNLVYWAWAVITVPLLWLQFKQYNYASYAIIGPGYSLATLFFTCCLLVALTNQDGWVSKFLGSRPVVELGILSYCIYLIHLPVVEACRKVLGLRFGSQTTATNLGGLLLGALLFYVIAKLSWRFFERPLLRRGHAYKY